MRTALADVPELADFADVIAAELGEVRTRRGAPGGDSSESPPLNEHLTGIALSGGGIRSATFNLGVLQGLGLEVLKRFDYLSTVSGGGYIGGWWSAFVTRHGANGAMFPDAEKTEFSREDCYVDAARRRKGLKEGSMYTGDPIHHLRLFSNYLTPRKGGLSGDSWRAITTVGRNLILTWLILLPMLIAVMFASNLYFAGSPCTRDDYPNLVKAADSPKGVNATRAASVKSAPQFPRGVLHAIGNVGVFFLILITLAVVAWALALHQRWRWWDYIIYPASGILTAVLVVLAFILFNEPAPPAACSLLDLMSHWLVLALGAFVAAYFLAGFVRACFRGELDSARSIAFLLQQRLLVHWVLITAVLGIAGFGPWIVDYVFVETQNAALEAGGWMALLGTAAAAIFTAIKASPSGGADQKTSHGTATRIVFCVAPPLLVLALAFASSALAAFLIREVVEEYGQVRSWDVKTLLNLIILTSMVIFTVLGVFEIIVKIRGAGKAGAWTQVRIALQFVDWLMIIAAIALLCVKAPWSTMPWEYVGLRPLISLAAVVAVGVFVAELIYGDNESLRSPSLLFLTVLGLFALPTIVWLANLSQDAYRANVHVTFGLLMLTLGWVAGAGWLADPNSLSMHLFYKSRLVRAYLGASNDERGREGYEITETAPGDDIELGNLQNTKYGAPYHIINTTLNLVAASDLATAQRSAASFELSKLYCGSMRTGYRPTTPPPGSLPSSAYMAGRLSLGTAVAISGAAASPNMGAKTMSGAIAMLMTLFNVRLGFWAPTPHRSFWRSPQARLWPVYLFQEFLSQTNDLSPYCYLTDGGHFDNTGAYALVARACRAIVIVDCGADPKRTFDDLGDLIRRCRIDFGAEIDLPNLKAFCGPVTNNRPYFISGTVKYSPEHLHGLHVTEQTWDGIIFVIKPTVNGTENADLLQFHRTHGVFPQQATSDQWFDEAQFESYRSLGERAGQFAAGKIEGALKNHC
ncbi:MAG: patatin-like phospholipase family protein [Thermoanaerobaculia bacterium]